MLVASDGSLIAKSTTLLSPSQDFLPLMPGYVHQLSLGYPMENRLSSLEIENIAYLFTFITSLFSEKLTGSMYE